VRQYDFGPALDVYRRALGLAREVGDQTLEARAWRGTADALTGLHRFQEAVESYDQATPAESSEPENVSWARWAAANIEPLALAAADHARAGQLAQAAGMWADIGQAAFSRWEWMSSYPARTAAEAYARAQELWRELGDRAREAEALMWQGHEHYSGPDAVAAYTRAQVIYRKLWDRTGWARARRPRRMAARGK